MTLAIQQKVGAPLNNLGILLFPVFFAISATPVLAQPVQCSDYHCLCGTAPAISNSSAFIAFDFGYDTVTYSLSASHPGPGINLGAGVETDIEFPPHVDVPATITGGQFGPLTITFQHEFDAQEYAIHVDANITLANTETGFVATRAVIDITVIPYGKPGGTGNLVRYLMEACPPSPPNATNDDLVVTLGPVETTCSSLPSPPVLFCTNDTKILFLCLQSSTLPPGTPVRWIVFGGENNYTVEPRAGITVLSETEGATTLVPITVTNLTTHFLESQYLTVLVSASRPRSCCLINEPFAAFLELASSGIRCSLGDQVFNNVNDVRQVTMKIVNPCSERIAGTWQISPPASAGYYTVTPTAGSFDLAGGQTLTQSVTVTNLQPHVDALSLSLHVAIDPQFFHLSANCGASGTLTFRNTSLTVLARQGDADGNAAGPLAGATVTVAGQPSGTTDSDGKHVFNFLNADLYIVTVTKNGFCPATRNVYVSAGDMKTITLVLQPDNLAGTHPIVFNVTSSGGDELIGIPNAIDPWTFTAEIAWNDNAGPGNRTAAFTVNGTEYQAPDVVLTDLACDRSRATVTVPVPASISSCSQLLVTATNRAGVVTMTPADVYFNPTPPIIDSWFGDFLWNVSQSGELSTSNSVGFSKEFGLGSAGPELELGFDGALQVKFKPLQGVFTGGGQASGSIGITWEPPPPGVPFNFGGDGAMSLEGNLEATLSGCMPDYEASWNVGLEGTAWISAPVVSILPVVLPPTQPVIDALRLVPGVSSQLNRLQVGLFLTLGLSLEGKYEDSTPGDCLLGSDGNTATGKIGIGAFVKLDLSLGEASIILGGEVEPAFEVCPEIEFNCLTLRAYVGLEAKVLRFRTSVRAGVSVSFGSCGNFLLSELPPFDATQQLTWEPIGNELLAWGPANELASLDNPQRIDSNRMTRSGGSQEELVVQNVDGLAAPSIIVDASQTHLAYALFDPDRPWYESTDIASLRSVDDGPWTQVRIADDDAGDFSPQIVSADSTTDLATWSQISGDVSGAKGPEEVFPHLEIAAAWFDRNTSQWTAPVLLTNNSVLDREPHSLVLCSSQGLVWIQKDSDALPGDALNPDRLMYSAWSGSDWSPPQTLWSDPKGITRVAVATDGAGQAHVLFAVDEDGDLETPNTGELYHVRTVGGSWQAAVRLTNDAVEDSQPVLITPGGNPIAVWSAVNTVTYSSLNSWNPRALFTESTDANEAPSLEGVTMSDAAAIAYAVQRPGGIDIVAAFYDSSLGLWSLPRHLTSDEHLEHSLALASDGSRLTIAYLKTQIERVSLDVEINGQMTRLDDVPQEAQTDLYLLTHEPGHDLAVDSTTIEIDPANPAPSFSATLGVRIENRGDLVAQNVEVGIYDGDPALGGSLIGGMQTIAGPLIGGSSHQLQVIWDVPPDESSHSLFVVVDPQMQFDDRDRTNNAASIQAVLPDLAIDALWSEPYSLKTVSLVARVVNTGAIVSAPCQLSWRLDEVDGPVVGSAMVGALAAGASAELHCIWNVGDYDFGEFLKVYAIVDDQEAVLESNESNNSDALIVPVPTPVPGGDCNGNSVPDDQDISMGTSQDCNSNGIPDECDIAWNTSKDFNINTVPDECELGDMNSDGTVNDADIPLFVDSLLNGPPDAYSTIVSDVNRDLQINGRDTGPFVNLFFSP